MGVLAGSGSGWNSARVATDAASLKYSPSLDGLRALAILGVLGFHTFPAALRGGFTGVDVFFVLSGYLIASVILYDIRNQRFSMREFYLRRIQRIVPNAALTIAVTVALYFLVLLPSLAVKVAEHGLWALFNLSNLYILRNFGGYWTDSAASSPLLHTWSLAVEEQFYLFFPAALLLLSRRAFAFGGTLCLALGSLALSIHATTAHPAAAFYHLETRAWEPLLGAALAAYLIPVAEHRPPRRLPIQQGALAAVGWIGLVLVIVGFREIAEGAHFPGFVALVPALGALFLVASVARGKTVLARLLALPPLVTIGKLSYSLYLWHWPLLVIGRTYADLAGRSPRTGELLGEAAGLGLAVMAYQFVERPMRQRGPERGRRLAALAAGFAACAALCLAVALRRPIADPLGQFDQPAFYGLLYNAADLPDAPVTKQTRYSDMLIPERAHATGIWESGGIVHSWGGGSPRVVVLGSSQALMYARVIDEVCKKLGVSVAFLAADGTPIFFPSNAGTSADLIAFSRSFDAARIRWLSEWNPDAVLAIDKWDNYEGDPQRFRGELESLIAQLAPHTRKVIVFSQVPVLRINETINLREYVTSYSRRFGHLPDIAADAREADRRASVEAIEALTQRGALTRGSLKVELLRVDPLFYRPDGSVLYASGRNFFYADSSHLSEAGAEMIRGLLTRAIADATASPGAAVASGP